MLRKFRTNAAFRAHITRLAYDRRSKAAWVVRTIVSGDYLGDVEHFYMSDYAVIKRYELLDSRLNRLLSYTDGQKAINRLGETHLNRVSIADSLQPGNEAKARHDSKRLLHVFRNVIRLLFSADKAA
jgi:hypothetical protein